MDPELRNALDLLRFKDLTSFEEIFLNSDAFLRPWAEFRDTYLLLQPSSMSTQEKESQMAIQRTDILYFYTLFDEGEKRYDSLADESSSEFTADHKKYGVIDKRAWGPVDHEKLLYVWLLQSFKVGKVHNPYGYTYFQCRNICSAWAKVFVPIVNAVRKDYSPKGRYHYGRLAKYIESVSPSLLAFPSGNISLPLPQSLFHGWHEQPARGTGDTDPVTNVLLRKQTKPDKTAYADDELELRTVYPQYGQVVERPKVKMDISEWVQVQRHNARLKIMEDLRLGVGK